MAELINYTLPEWVFLDGFSHQGNLLKNRTVIQHIRSYTVIEAIALDDLSISDMKAKPYPFTFENSFGIVEKAIAWYCEYLKWEDENIQNDSVGSEN